ncbi:MAG: type VI secretion protein [Rhodospirillales bacterium 20-64-7]|nr:MAG: type VI secretion protein [Rhodospirillales bacterium 20-64-7]HQT78051.1 PAAR domain-containing protein [Rhodopila sp.]
MGQPAACIGDMHTCPLCNGPVPHVGGPIVLGDLTVLTGSRPAARSTDQLVCVGPPDVIALGSLTVFIGSLPAARMGDVTAHGGVIVSGCARVLIG